MQNLIVAPRILEKLASKSPPVTLREVEQCFDNRPGGVLEDPREKHKTNPPTLWFVSPTNNNRLLKVVYIQDGSSVILKSAFEPNADERRIYLKYAC